MSAASDIQPKGIMPLSVWALEREVAELERTLDLVRRRDAARAELAKLKSAVPVVKVASEVIVELVAVSHGVAVGDLRGRSDARGVVAARHELFHLMQMELKSTGVRRWSNGQIGRLAGTPDRVFDPSTVLCGARRFRAQLEAAA